MELLVTPLKTAEIAISASFLIQFPLAQSKVRKQMLYRLIELERVLSVASTLYFICSTEMHQNHKFKQIEFN
jgi:hypothetical protein